MKQLPQLNILTTPDDGTRPMRFSIPIHDIMDQFSGVLKETYMGKVTMWLSAHVDWDSEEEREAFLKTRNNFPHQ